MEIAERSSWVFSSSELGGALLCGMRQGLVKASVGGGAFLRSGGDLGLSRDGVGKGGCVALQAGGAVLSSSAVL